MPNRQVPVRLREPLAFPDKANGIAHEPVALHENKNASTLPHPGSAHANADPEILALIHRLVRRGDCVVELGCADGRNLNAIAEAAGEDGDVIGIDSSPDHIHHLRNNVRLRRIKNLRLFLSRGDSLPIPPAYADLILCQGLVSPSGSRQAVYREILRVLRPGGALVVHDIVVHKLLPPEIADSVAAFASGLAGAIEAESYRCMLAKLDLQDLQLTHCPSTDFIQQLLIPSAVGDSAKQQVESALVKVRGILPNFISIVRIFGRKSAG